MLKAPSFCATSSVFWFNTNTLAGRLALAATCIATRAMMLLKMAVFPYPVGATMNPRFVLFNVSTTVLTIVS